MKIYSVMLTGGPQVFYTPEFRAVVEDHLTYLKQQVTNTVVDISPHDAYKYQGDFFGILLEYKVLPQFHWIVMRMNDMMSPKDYDGETLTFIRPDEKVLISLANTFNSQSTIRV